MRHHPMGRNNGSNQERERGLFFSLLDGSFFYRTPMTLHSLSLRCPAPAESCWSRYREERGEGKMDARVCSVELRVIRGI